MAEKSKKLVTTAGAEYDIRPISDTLITLALNQIEKKFKEAGEPITPPQYRVETAGGGEQWFDHDETTLRTDEEKTAWAAHTAAKRRMEAEQENRRLEMLMDGIVFEVLDDGWEARHRKYGIEVPDKNEDPDAYRRHYLTTEVLVTPDDLLNALELVTKASYKGGVDEAAIEAAMATFRRSLLENSTRKTQDRAGTVESQPEDGGGGGSEGVGDLPQPVPDAE